MQMTATVSSAYYFIPFVLPLCLWVAWSDLSRMKIPNRTVLILFGVFVLLGPLALPFEEYLWRMAGAGLVLALGFVLYLFGGIGAGDIKFAAAMAPFFSHGDLALVLYLFSGVLVAAVVTHQVAQRIGFVTAATPDWKSWGSRKFPMGLALTGTLAFYLVLVAFLGS